MATQPTPSRSASADQRPVALAVAVDQVVLQLDEEVLPAERLDVASRRLLRLAIAPGGDQRRHLALLAAGEGDEPLAVPGQRLEVERRLAALARGVGVREEEAEVGVAPLRLAEEGDRVELHVPQPLRSSEARVTWRSPPSA